MTTPEHPDIVGDMPIEPIQPTDPQECEHDLIINHECADCDTPFLRLRHHLCCWAWKAALIVPLIHVVLHFLGLPHPEVISFIP